MFLPISTDVALRRPPVVNYVLIALNVGMFVIVGQFLDRTVRGMMLNEKLMLWAESPQWYQFITSMFMHGGWWHLIGNMVFLWVFGNALNSKLGHATYLMFYLACGLVAGAGYVLFQTNPVVGASGAIFGVAGGFLVLFPLSRVTTVYFFFFIGVLELNGLIVVGYFVVINMIYLLSGYEAGVAYLAHLFGAFTGLTAAAALLATGAVGRDQFDLLALIRRWRQRNAYRAYMGDSTNRARAQYGRVAQPLDDYGRPIQQVVTVSPEAARIAALRAELGQAIAAGLARQAGELYRQLRAADPEQALPAQQQANLGNYLMSDGQHELAAVAYESLLSHYPAYEASEQIEMLLGVIYGRYLNKPIRAKTYLERALARLRDAGQREFCQHELDRVNGMLGG